MHLQGPLTPGPLGRYGHRGRMDFMPRPFGERVARIRRNRQPGRAGEGSRLLSILTWDTTLEGVFQQLVHRAALM